LISPEKLKLNLNKIATPQKLELEEQALVLKDTSKAYEF